GGVTLDRVARSAAEPVLGASNPGTVRRLPGGVGFNVATVLARLGFRTRMVSAVGDDADGAAVLAAAGEVGLDVSFVARLSGKDTASYHATFDDRGNLIIGIADMKICDAIAPADVVHAVETTPPGDFWVVDANLPEETLAFLASEAAAAKRPVAALTVSPAKAVRLEPILDLLTLLFTNRKEAATLLGFNPDDPSLAVPRLASELAGRRQTRVVVTNGSEPLAAAAGSEVRSYAPLRVAVTAVNGAGDSFAAGVILGLAEGHSLHDALRFGLAAAAMTLEAGSILAAPFSPDALAERIGRGPRLAPATERVAS
ncbi:MAG TPA: PfkB family carbohydrate kinase, partial [Bauldia sp.]|nr:PfkB family carbohydrate kinase [Bauldia sp.]